ncbi:MAG: hypothetical protein ACLQBB_13515 [Solirubrobacteraceae bacterium]
MRLRSVEEMTATAIILAVIVVLGLGFAWTRRRRPLPGRADEDEVRGPVMGTRPGEEPHHPLDYIGEEPGDLDQDPATEAERWERERERREHDPE